MCRAPPRRPCTKRALAGDLLRAERDSGSPDGAMITQSINEGKIVPVEVTVALIQKAMRASGASKFLIDGFPRNANNLAGWHTVMGDTATVDGVLFYECPEAVMESRLLRRGEHSGRSDDKADVIKASRADAERARTWRLWPRIAWGVSIHYRVLSLCRSASRPTCTRQCLSSTTSRSRERCSTSSRTAA